MSEIVRINASGQVGIVRATYLNTETGEELVEVQIARRLLAARARANKHDFARAMAEMREAVAALDNPTNSPFPWYAFETDFDDDAAALDNAGDTTKGRV